VPARTGRCTSGVSLISSPHPLWVTRARRLHRIARLAELAPEVAELDVNPLVAAPGGAFAVDVKVRLLPAPAIPDAYDRRLR
jgi:hypothetical protein